MKIGKSSLSPRRKKSASRPQNAVGKRTSRTSESTDAIGDMVLDAIACVECTTGLLKKTRGARTYPVNGEDVKVPGAEFMKCNVCGATALGYDQIRLLREKAFAIYRESNGLLTPDEIRGIRERLGLSQAALGRLLRVGPNTLSRWEGNRIVQSASLNSLLQVIRDVPGALEYLEQRAA